MESSIHGLSEPDMLAVLALAGPPVLLWYLGDAWVDAGLSGLHVTEDLDGVFNLYPLVPATDNDDEFIPGELFHQGHD